MGDLTSLPTGLPEPVDDGLAEHLPGTHLPRIALLATDGSRIAIDMAATPFTVLFVYPRTGTPGVDLPKDWDLIPGARGCTPQACAFRDLHDELSGLGATVWGLSAQPIEEQAWFAANMEIGFPLLNDSDLRLADPPLSLPTFRAGGVTLYKRLTMVAEEGRITKVFYPVFPPDRNAESVISYLISVV